MNTSTSLALYQDPLSLDVNTATQEELQRHVPGVGRVLAQRIVAYREEHGLFQDEADVARVPGVNRRVAALLAPYALVEPGPSSGPPSGPRWLTSPPSNVIVLSEPPLEPEEGVILEATMPRTPRATPAPAPPVPAATPAPAPRTKARTWLTVGLVLLGIGAGHVMGVWLNARSIEAPRRELVGRIEAVQADQAAAADSAAAEGQRWRSALQSLTGLVDDESTEQRAALEKSRQDLEELRGAAKRSGARTDAQLQRLREDVDRIERQEKLRGTGPAAAGDARAR